MSNIRAEQFSNSDELKGMVKAFLYDKVDSKRCLEVKTDQLSISETHYIAISFCYEQTDKESKMAYLELAIHPNDTCYEIREKVNKAIKEIEDAD